MTGEEIKAENVAEKKVCYYSGSGSYNPAHILVSEIHLLSEDESKKVLDGMGVDKDKLPKIKDSDPQILYLKDIHGSVEEGSVVKIIRKSETAGEFIVYRLVIKG